MNNSGNAELNYCYKCMARLDSGQTVCPVCGHDNSRHQNTENQLPEGTILAGKYLVGCVLGQGGFGITYLGLDTALNVKVAIKEYFPAGIGTRAVNAIRVIPISDRAQEESFRKGCDEFQEEARRVADIDSPYIVKVRDYFRENGTAYIIMNYLEGKSLTKEVADQGGKIPWPRVVDLFSPLILEIDKLHEEHLIHRDIKPDNIKLVKDKKGAERLVLLDFGAARSFVSAEATGTYSAMVTQGYAPVEQYSRQAHQGPYTDIYALCATMYAAITGTRPPQSNDRMMGLVGLSSFTDLGIDVPKDIEKAILHGLEVRSEDRPQSMRELYDELNGKETAARAATMPIDPSPSKPLKQEARKPSGEEKPKKKANPLLPVLLAVLLAAGFFIWRGVRQNQLNTSAASTQTAEAGMTEQAALNAEQTGTAWNITAAAEYQQTQTQAAAEAHATQAEQESRIEQTVQIETQAAMNTASAEQSYQTATAWFTSQEALLHQTQTAMTGRSALTEQALSVIDQTREAVEAAQTEVAGTQAAFNALSTQNAWQQTQDALHFAQTEVAETQNAISAAQTKSAEPTATPTPEPTVSADALFELGEEAYQNGDYEQALEHLLPAAEAGHAEAQYRLGKMYDDGDGVEQSYEEAARWYQLAADQGDVYAQYNLGVMYENGDGVEQSYEEAANWYQQAADQGDADAQYNLGSMYENGDGVEQSYEEAATWYQQAAEQGLTDAQNKLGSLYANGDGVEQSFEEALTWYQQAAEQGLADAQYNLGVMYENGDGVEQSYEEAANRYQQAAEQGHADAQFNLGALYANGDGVEQSYEDALTWYQAAADQGHAAAQNQLGDMYYYGNGTEQSYEEALNLYQQAAEQEYADAQYNLGLMYANGNGVEQSYEDAADWYQQAADQGHAAAQYNLGLLYANGNGVEQSWEEALNRYQQAAEQGDADAQYTLGQMYETGEGVEQSYEEALNWYQQAAGQGDADAQYALGYMYAGARGTDQSYEEAAKWYQLAAEQGHEKAQNNLGWMYEKGNGVEQSFEEAVRWYQMAADQGYARAQYNLGVMYENGRGVDRSYEEAAKWYRLAADQGHEKAETNLNKLLEKHPELKTEDDNTSAEASSSRITDLSAGDIITFGEYEQDGDPDNGTEAIEWQVLAVEEGRALVISKYGLDTKKYHYRYNNFSVTWETSSLRKWLNGEFYDNAFSEEEKGQIREESLINPDNAAYGTTGGNDTTDRIFLLSIEEAEQYFADDEARQCEPTTYAENNGALVSDKYAGSTWWWLRSPGDAENYAAAVYASGNVHIAGRSVNDSRVTARPAFWLDL